jgi:hypothetical protein
MLKSQYINYDLNLNKFFVNADHYVVTNPDKRYYSLDKKIYFQPSASPLVHVSDSELGSCFERLTIPTASWIYNGNGTRQQLPMANDITSYTQQIYQNIDQSIAKIYNQHLIVNLMYSGGIDSMVLLSYILKQGLGPRTRLVSFENITQTHPSRLGNNSIKKSKVVDLYSKYQDQLHSTIWHTVDINHVVNAFNYGNLADIKCYVTKAILDQYQDSVFMFGHHGNQVLLHKDIFLDAIILQQPNIRSRIQTLQSCDNYYTSSLSKYQVSNNPIGLERRHFLIKPWSALQGYRNNLIYSPIGSNENFQLTRGLDFSKIDPWTIMDATVAKDIIHQNVGDSFDPYIDTESIKENDNLEVIQLPIDELDPDMLTIPTDLNHNQVGLDYLQYELSRAQCNTRYTSKWLSINAAVSIKSLQYISQTY